MKLKSFLLFSISLFILYVIISCSSVTNESNELTEIISLLKGIESAEYISHVEDYAPFDTTPQYNSFYYVKGYTNPGDTFAGAKYVELYYPDTTKMYFCYDGLMKGTIYEEEKELLIDSFKVNNHPFRLVGSPFYIEVMHLLKYFNGSNDSIMISRENDAEAIHYSFTIYGDNVSIIGCKIVHNPHSDDDISKYDFWFDKKTKMPYKLIQNPPHYKLIQEISNVKYNTLDIDNFHALDYFPSDFEIREFLGYNKKTNLIKHILLNQKAPNWTLQTGNGIKYTLSDYLGKVVLIQFTSEMCGPCLLSVPFMNKLKMDFSDKDFDYFAIETGVENKNAINHYVKKNNINYKFLFSKKTTKDYKVSLNPTFFILNKDLKIMKVEIGYTKNVTDSIITSEIKKLL